MSASTPVLDHFLIYKSKWLTFKWDDCPVRSQSELHKAVGVVLNELELNLFSFVSWHRRTAAVCLDKTNIDSVMQSCVSYYLLTSILLLRTDSYFDIQLSTHSIVKRRSHRCTRICFSL